MQNRNWAMLFSVLLLLLHLVAASPPPDPPDALALLAFKSDADLGNELPFSQDKAFCEWHGVKCAGGRAVHVVIEGIPLGGVFRADSLTRLDQLRILSLQNDSLTGPIPDLSGLLNLRSLFLSHNSFAGYFPPSISFLLKLRTLDLSYNNLTGPLPASLTSIHRLYDLRLDRNRFNGSIPPLNQTSLRFFNVSGNDLSGAVPVTAALLRFPAASFTSNPGLCGEIVRKECHPNQPFFESSPAEVAPPTEEARGISGRLGDVHRQARAEEEKRVGAIIGFSTGVFVLVLSVVLFTLAVRKQRGARSRRALTPAMSSDSSAAAEAAAVMRIEEADELGEKVKKVQQNHGGGGVTQVGRTGSLVFCAGEAQVYTLDQLMRASAELLGRGTVGTTYKAVLDNRLIVCVKRLDACKTACTGREAFERHMGSVGGLRHPNLVPLRAFFQAKEERLLVYDYQPNGSLHSLIHGSKSARAKPLHWTSCLKIAEDVAQGLSYIHQAWRLVHGNLKSSNVLLGADFEALLTDYSLALPTDDDNDPHSATSKSDVCAFGILLLELLTGKPPSEHPNLGPGGHLLDWVRSARSDGDGGGEEGKMGMVVEVAAACVVPVPERRPTMWQVLKMIQEIKEAVMEDRELLDPIISAGEAYS